MVAPGDGEGVGFSLSTISSTYFENGTECVEYNTFMRKRVIRCYVAEELSCRLASSQSNSFYSSFSFSLSFPFRPSFLLANLTSSILVW